MKQEIVDWWKNQEAAGCTLAECWHLHGLGGKVCGDIQRMIAFFEHDPDWWETILLKDLKKMLTRVKEENTLTHFSLETLLDTLVALQRKKDANRRAEWEVVERLVRDLICDTKTALTRHKKRKRE